MPEEKSSRLNCFFPILNRRLGLVFGSLPGPPPFKSSLQSLPFTKARMGSGASSANYETMTSSTIADAVSQINNGAYGEYVELFKSNNVDGATLKTNLGSEPEFTSFLAGIGLNNENVQHNMYEEFSKLNNLQNNAGAAAGPSMGGRAQSVNMKAKMRAIEDQQNAEMNKLTSVMAAKKESEAKRLKDRLIKKRQQRLEALKKQGVLHEAAIAEVDEKHNEDVAVIDKATEIHKEDGHYAAREALHHMMIEWFFDWIVGAGLNINQADNNGLTTLMLCAQSGDKLLVEMMLNKGCDVNVTASDLSAALHVAAQWGHHEVVDILISRGANVNAANSDLWTPLLFASIGGHTECVSHLVNAGADLEAEDTDGFTACMYAQEGEHSEIVEILMKAGARDLSGFTGTGEAMEGAPVPVKPVPAAADAAPAPDAPAPAEEKPIEAVAGFN